MASASSSDTVQKQADHRRKSCDTVCSSNSSCFFQKRKPVHPLAANNTVRAGVTRSGGSVRQRVLSAKLLKMRTLQNQLNDVNFHLAELMKENRALKTLQKRQDKALAKYEGEDADLQRILRSYENEVRVLHEKNKILRKTVRELNENLKIRDEEYFAVREQLKHLTNLTKDKHLKEREKLTEEVEDLKLKLKANEEQINILNRKLMLEQKNSKHKLNNEMCKNRQFERQLNEALSEIDRLNGGSDFKTKGQLRKRFSTQRQAVSMVSLHPKEETNSNTKLEPIIMKPHNNQNNSTLESILKSPTDNIKARLSSAEKRNIVHMGVSFEKINLNEQETAGEENANDEVEESIPRSTKSAMHTHKLNPLLYESEKKKKIDDDEILGGYYKEVVSSVNRCNTTIDSHKTTLQQNKDETEELLKKLRETDRLTNELKNTSFVTDNADEVVNEIWEEEYKFQKQNNQSTAEEFLVKVTDRNGNETRKEPRVTLEEKRKLLETLKAIDNGEAVDVPITDIANRKSKLMKELFGSTDNCVRK